MSATTYQRSLPLRDDEYEPIENVEIRPEDLSDEVKRGLAVGFWKSFQRFMQRPDADELLDAELERLQRENSPLLNQTHKTKSAIL